MRTNRMNKTASIVTTGLAIGLLASVLPAAAQTETTTTKTTTYTGMVSEVNPATSTIILKSESSNAPVTYTYSKETSFVDANGNVVTSETIRNAPVRVEYSTEDGRTVVRRVIQTGPSVVLTPPPAVVREKTTTKTETETR